VSVVNGWDGPCYYTGVHGRTDIKCPGAYNLRTETIDPG